MVQTTNQKELMFVQRRKNPGLDFSGAYLVVARKMAVIKRTETLHVWTPKPRQARRINAIYNHTTLYIIILIKQKSCVQSETIVPFISMDFGWFRLQASHQATLAKETPNWKKLSVRTMVILQLVLAPEITTVAQTSSPVKEIGRTAKLKKEKSQDGKPVPNCKWPTRHKRKRPKHGNADWPSFKFSSSGGQAGEVVVPMTTAS